MKCNLNRSLCKNYKIKIYPNDIQSDLIEKQIHLFRYTYNWALDRYMSYYNETKKSISKFTLMKNYSDYRNQEENSWLRDLPLSTGRHAILNVFDAFSMFYKKNNRFPVKKDLNMKKKRKVQRLNMRGDRLKFYSDGVKIEGIQSHINIKTFDISSVDKSKFYNCSISSDGYDYWLSFTVEQEPSIEEPINLSDKNIGIDLGVRKLAVLSDGTEYVFPDSVNKLDKRIRRIYKRVKRDRVNRKNKSAESKIDYYDLPKTKGEINRERDLHYAYTRQTNIRHTFIHTMTREIVNKRPKNIVMENIDVANLIRISPSKLSHKIQLASFYTIRSQIEYKAREYGINVKTVERDYPSSQICSSCGFRRKKFSGHTFVCPSCGLRIDRDLNAALNLENRA